MRRGSKKKKQNEEPAPQDEREASESDVEESADDTPLAVDEVDFLKQELERAHEERAQFEDKLKHALADMANMRRRATEDAVRTREQAVGRITQEILPVLDAFELALASEGDRENLLEGVRMVHSMLEDLLGRHGVEAIVADGATFDPKLHEAIATEVREDVEAGTIVAVHQNGFRLRGSVLRPARVVVSAAPAQPTDESGTDDANEDEV